MPIRVVIIGAGAHGLIVADILFRLFRAGTRRSNGDLDLDVDSGAAEPIGFVDDAPRLTGTRVMGLEVLGTRDVLRTVAHDAVIVAIGDNARRAAICEGFARNGKPDATRDGALSGARLISACHPDASIGSTVEMGDGCMLSAGVVITPDVRLGRGVILNTRCSVDHHSVIGDFVHVGPGATIGANVVIGDRALIGLGASVMSGRLVGAGTIVGAGAVVTRDLPDRVVAMGVPARVVRSIPDPQLRDPGPDSD
jgi:sugar O-acyltransferase (sialic acid O-acetyltransferase NeuD family)